MFRSQSLTPSAAAADFEGDGVAEAGFGVAEGEGVAAGAWLPEEGAGCSGQLDAVEDPAQSGLCAVDLEGDALPAARDLGVEGDDRSPPRPHAAPVGPGRPRNAPGPRPPPQPTPP